MIPKLLIIQMSALSVAGAVGITYVASEPRISASAEYSSPSKKSVYKQTRSNFLGGDGFKQEDDSDDPDKQLRLLGAEGDYDEVYIGRRPE